MHQKQGRAGEKCPFLYFGVRGFLFLFFLHKTFEQYVTTIKNIIDIKRLSVQSAFGVVLANIGTSQ